MKRGDAIVIREIHNGVMIEPCNQNMSATFKDTIAFQDAESFIKWIKAHFGVYTIPNWEDEASNKSMDADKKQ